MHVYDAFAPARICAASTVRDAHSVLSNQVLTLAFAHLGHAQNMPAYPRLVECV